MITTAATILSFFIIFWLKNSALSGGVSAGDEEGEGGNPSGVKDAAAPPALNGANAPTPPTSNQVKAPARPMPRDSAKTATRQMPRDSATHLTPMNMV